MVFGIIRRIQNHPSDYYWPLAVSRVSSSSLSSVPSSGHHFSSYVCQCRILSILIARGRCSVLVAAVLSKFQRKSFQTADYYAYVFIVVMSGTSDIHACGGETACTFIVVGKIVSRCSYVTFQSNKLVRSSLEDRVIYDSNQNTLNLSPRCPFAEPSRAVSPARAAWLQLGSQAVGWAPSDLCLSARPFPPAIEYQ